jgi:dienelactone hydrolase
MDVQLRAQLFMPGDSTHPVSAVVITPSSGGIKSDIELHYAEAFIHAGIAALVIDSFGSRGLNNSVHDQSVLTPFQSTNDAFGGLRWLARDKRFRADRIGITGVSKGGAAALNSAFTMQRHWMSISPRQAFAAHAPIVPPCYWVNRTLATTGAPIYFMLAELDDQTPADQCVALAHRMRKAGNLKIEVTVYKGAHHAWEVLGANPYFDPLAENHAKCMAVIEDDGRSVWSKDGSTIPRHDVFGWSRRNCMTLGTHCCGGNDEQKRVATANLISFFKRNGF